jgi:uncharacterized membrane protein
MSEKFLGEGENSVPVPLSLRVFLHLSGALITLYVVTGPWRIGGLTVDRVSYITAFPLLILIGGLLASRRWRHWLRWGAPRVDLDRRRIAIGFLLLFCFLAWVVIATWRALEINAWDFSLHYDLPLERTLRGELLYSEHIQASTFSEHASYVLLLFVPLYALVATPIWLHIATAAAIAAGSALLYALSYSSGRDRLIALMISLSFAFNPFTVKAVQYGFHPELFYPAAIFLLLLALERRSVLLFAAGLLLTVAIKEDSILVLAGVGLIAALRRQAGWSLAAAATGVGFYVLNTKVVMPSFGVSDVPFYLTYWHSWGDTRLEVILSILRDPIMVVERIVGSGTPRLFLSLLFAPLFAPVWTAGSLPALVLYSIADHPQLSQFALYYSMPVLPFLYAALPAAIRTLGSRLVPGEVLAEAEAAVRRRGAMRCAALVLLIWSAQYSGYRIREPRPEGPAVRSLLGLVEESRSLVVQGALMPHAGYRVMRAVERVDPGDAEVFLLAPGADPYPLTRDQLSELIVTLRSDPRYRLRADERGVLLFTRSTR